MGAQVHLDAFEFELAGFDLRIVQQVVDHEEEGIGARLDDAGVFALAAVEVGVEQERRHADDAVHRRADFVAHIGQEFAPDPAGGVGLFPRIGERRAQFRELPLKFCDTRVAGIAQGPPHPGHSSHKPEVRPTYYCQNRLQVKTLGSSPQQRLLIVEDDVHMAYLLGYLAEKERFGVETIADGRKARERIDAGDAVDLVLLDVMLPYTDGFELLERLRASADWKNVPVIILTSRTREHDAVRALGLGADDYLTKPFSPAELVARIRRRIGSRT